MALGFTPTDHDTRDAGEEQAEQHHCAQGAPAGRGRGGECESNEDFEDRQRDAKGHGEGLRHTEARDRGA